MRWAGGRGAVEAGGLRLDVLPLASAVPYGGAEALRDLTPYRERNWNQLLPTEQDQVLEVALRYPDRSSREISCQVADTCGFTVSESTVYRLLKQAG